METKTIKQLRQTGYKVRVLHTRNYDMKQRLGGEYRELSNFGGYTKIEVTTPDQSITVAGEAHCSTKDNFNRRVGNSIALGRALSKLNQ